MNEPTREYWFLVALEATLFFSWGCWELTAPWAEPITSPGRFAVSILLGATLATCACHLGPAVFAARLKGRRFPWAWLLLLWLGLGYMERILTGFSLVTLSQMMAPGGSMLRWYAAGLIFLGIVAAAIWAKGWLRALTLLQLCLGVGVLGWAFATTWNGIWTPNPYYSTAPVQFEALIVRGMILSAAPALQSLNLSVAVALLDQRLDQAEQLWKVSSFQIAGSVSRMTKRTRRDHKRDRKHQRCQQFSSH